MTMRRSVIAIRYAHVAGLVCARLGVPSAKVHQNRMLRGGNYRARAIICYLVVTRYNETRRKLARARGVHHTSVMCWCRAVEEWRDDAGFDALIAEFEAKLGAAG